MASFYELKEEEIILLLKALDKLKGALEERHQQDMAHLERLRNYLLHREVNP